MPDGELKSAVEGAIRDAQAAGMKDMGKVMKVLLPQVARKRRTGKRVSDLVKELLSKM